MVERLFLAVPRGCLQFVIVVFPDHIHLLFLKVGCRGSSESTLVNISNCWQSHATALISYLRDGYAPSVGFKKVIFILLTSVISSAVTLTLGISLAILVLGVVVTITPMQ